MQTGDVLILEASAAFVKAREDDSAFALVSLTGATPTKWNRSILALLLLVVMVVGQVLLPGACVRVQFRFPLVAILLPIYRQCGAVALRPVQQASRACLLVYQT